MSEHITETPTVKRLERSSQNKFLAGVCGGLGRYFDLNPNVFRLGLVVLTLLGGAGILVYIAALLVMPAEGEPQSIAERALAERRDHPWRLVALGLVGVAIAVLLTRADSWPSAGAGWFFVLVAGLIVLWASRERGARRAVLAIVGVLAVLLATAVTAIAVAFSWFDVSLGDGVGDRTYTPAAVSDVRQQYELGIGDLRVDLSRLHTDRPLLVKAKVGMGKLRVIVPAGTAVAVDSHVKAGSISALDRTDNGRNAHVQVGSAGRLTLDASVGAGRIEVVRAG
jgi:phage shock protein PspC (stress-responsive transcriptional regulator)/predicted membrane protein